MFQAFSCSQSVIRVQCQHSPQKVQGTLINVAVLRRIEVEVHLLVAFENSLGVASIKEISTHQ